MNASPKHVFTSLSSLDTLPIGFQWNQFSEAAHTAFLFTKSDIKTILIPITSFGLIAAKCTSLHTGLLAVAWVWLYLLQFCVSNQSISPDEDALNKPWRPIPSGRITVSDSRWLRWTLLFACLTLSFHHNVIGPAVALTLGIWTNNELRLDNHWLTRGICNALGYASFNAGATAMACVGHPSIFQMDRRVLLTHLGGALVVLTTIHAQDFEDEQGDRVQGRKTMPIVMPYASRLTMAVGLTGWSIALSWFWGFELWLSCLFVLSGVGIASRYLLLFNQEQNKRSYLYYNLWLCIVQILPLCSGGVDAPVARFL